MVRMPVPSTKKQDGGSNPYPLWVFPEQLKTIEAAQSRSPLTWPEWVSQAIKQFQKESQAEIDALLNAWIRSRAGKVRITIRINDATMAEIDEICIRTQGGNKQACLQHALFIHALRSID